MTILELHKKGFDTAVEELAEERNEITSYETLKDFIKEKIDDDNLIFAAHLIEALNNCPYAEYYQYDYSMGTLETPYPLRNISDLEDLCDGKSYKVMAHINSLHGDMDEITILEERRKDNQTYYIAKYKDIFCTAIFNGFNCTYYADDIYGKVENL
jgi:hypothetical protein